MIAIRIYENGGPETLRVDTVATPVPKAGQLRIRVEATGVNFVEIYYRSGLYKSELPLTLGSETAGIVTALGDGVTVFRVGDRVATVRGMGTYAEEVLVAASDCVQVPERVSSRTAAAVMLQGMTAHYLACDTFPLKSGDTALIHAGAGGVGLLLTQIAKMRGARVLATVSSDEKAALARAAGADAVCIYSRENFTEAARAFTDGRGVDVVYDSVGKTTFEGSLQSLRPRGMFVSFGNASGPIAPFPPLVLSQHGSLFFTRPTLAHYAHAPAELRARSDDLFAWLAADRLSVRIGGTFPLASAAEAHRALEGRATTGKLLLVP
jgi:NADPH2:quinone reductase